MTLSSGVVAKVMSGKRASDAMQRTTTAVTIFNAGYKVCRLPQIMILLALFGLQTISVFPTVSGRIYEPMGQMFLPWIC